ncbi:MAG: polymer-forming cytoskeletal protein [Bilophila sp.]
MGKEEINAFLGSGTVYEGKLSFQGAVRIDGRFSGEVTSDGALIVGKDAIIDGLLEVGELVLSGTFSGEANISRRATVHKTGVFQGRLRTEALMVEEGASIDGQIHMRGTPEEQQENKD